MEHSYLCPHCGKPRLSRCPPANLPICPPQPSQSELMRRLLESIAHEEMALAHIVNTEACKLEKASKCVMGPITPDELVALQRSVSDVLDKLVKKEDLLLRKLRLILAFDREHTPICEEE